DNGWHGTSAISFSGSGTGQFTDCSFAASDLFGSGCSRVFHVADSASLTLSGCSLESTEENDHKTCYGVYVTDEARLTLRGTGRAGTGFTGFPLAVRCDSADALLTITSATFTSSERAIEVDDLDVLPNATGLTFADSGEEVFVHGNSTVDGTVTLGPARYTIDCHTGPITVAAGATLTVPAGCVIDNAGHTSPPYDLFTVAGTLTATEAGFELTTHGNDHHDNGWHGTSAISFSGSGTGQFTDCSFAASDLSRSDRSRVFHVADSASLTLSGCSLESTDENNHRTCYGVYIQSASTLTLENSGLFSFPVGLHVESVPATATVGGNDFAGNSTYAVENTAPVDLDCRGNWWGHNSGPQHRTNPLGLGSPVSDHVIFESFEHGTDMPTATLADHPQGQAANAFTHSGDLVDAILLRFALSSESSDCYGLVFRLSSIEGLDDTDLTNARLVQDTDGDGDLDLRADPVLAPAKVDTGTGTIAVSADFAAAGDFLLVADVVNLASGDTLSVTLFAPDIEVDPGVWTAGGVKPAHHYLDRLYVQDHTNGQISDCLLAHASQQDVPLLAFHLTAGYDVQSLSFTLSLIEGIDAANIVEPQLVIDDNSNLFADAGETVIGGGTVWIAGDSGTITFDLSQLRFATGADMLLRADFDGLYRDDQLVVHLDASGVTSGAPGTSTSGATTPVAHYVEAPLVLLDAAFQVHNGFQEAAQHNDVHLLGFMFMPAGRRVEGLTFQLWDVEGIGAADVSDARIVRDTNRNGRIEAGEVSPVGGPGAVSIDVETGAGTIAFTEPFTVQGDYIL
ncbi:hypothetical protein HQ590_13685, partial [bacterium]|nr:hypothetical protein [bacterium]